MAKMKPETKARLSIQERTYRALSSIAHAEAKWGIVNEDIIADSVVEWTTDNVTMDAQGAIWSVVEGAPTKDLTSLFSFVLSHLHTHEYLEENMQRALALSERIEAVALDPVKLGNQDPEEWNKLAALVGGGGVDSVAEEFEIPDTLEEFLSLAGEDAPHGGSASEVFNKAILEKVNRKTQATKLMSYYFEQVLAQNHNEVHDLIDNFGCGLTHAVTGMFLMWLQSRSTLPDGVSLQEWAQHIKESSESIDKLSDEEKIEMHKQFNDDDEDE
jgi:hypothetical protein